ncbi:hypothetical protein H920_14652 [Fukomys damarensis]|uniref:Uncharacterized protein n=1 Tax=Fukomys damarensis TaxID=885580 RepID=A0A091DMA7_FUKDA|nr:hypothetical protein H920_14652 [Fukomys damarensis]
MWRRNRTKESYTRAPVVKQEPSGQEGVGDTCELRLVGVAGAQMTTATGEWPETDRESSPRTAMWPVCYSEKGRAAQEEEVRHAKVTARSTEAVLAVPGPRRTPKATEDSGRSC